MSEKYQKALLSQLGEVAVSMHHSAGAYMVPGWDGYKVSGLLKDAQNEIVQLQAQVEQLRTEAKVASDRIQELGRFTKAQRGEIEGLRADAERYRFVRLHRLWLKANLPGITADKFDAAIDSARAGREDGNG